MHTYAEMGRLDAVQSILKPTAAGKIKALNTFSDNSIRWFIALSVAAMQTANAMYAIISASLDRLARDACLAGIIGAQLSLFILAVVVVWSVVLAVKSLKSATWHEGLKPLGVVALSSTIAIFLGARAATICFP